MAAASTAMIGGANVRPVNLGEPAKDIHAPWSAAKHGKDFFSVK